ncbi:MAG: bacteriocin-protection protein, YdeI/OmpD-associated family [Proteobacteria bacterium]|nr:MAG: bacteriocin-protection protein, YdeI/OmpD-associated family [Pseudomonadota bacterium]
MGKDIDPTKTAKFFKTQSAFRSWLEKNHESKTELWIGFYKKGSALKAMDYKEALDEALCYGWVDGLKGTIDDQSYRIRFTPRKAKSLWSKVNIGHVERLILEKKMTAVGLARIEEAKADGRWDNSYASSSTASMPDEFFQALAKNKKAKAFYATLNKTQIYSMYFRIHNAKKPETKLRWVERIVLMLEKGKTFHMP